MKRSLSTYTWTFSQRVTQQCVVKDVYILNIIKIFSTEKTLHYFRVILKRMLTNFYNEREMVSKLRSDSAKKRNISKIFSRNLKRRNVPSLVLEWQVSYEQKTVTSVSPPSQMVKSSNIEMTRMEHYLQKTSKYIYVHCIYI